MPKRILVVEDDHDTREMLKIILQDMNLDVVLSSRAMTSGEILNINPDVILTDINLNPFEMTGDEFCKQVKEHSGTSLIPVILVSAERNLETLAHDCHADGYFHKPFDIFQLRRFILSKLI